MCCLLTLEFFLVSWEVNAEVHTKDSSRGKRTQEEGNRKSGQDGLESSPHGVKQAHTFPRAGPHQTPPPAHLPRGLPGNHQHRGFKGPSLLSPMPGPEATLATFCVWQVLPGRGLYPQLSSVRSHRIPLEGFLYSVQV